MDLGSVIFQIITYSKTYLCGLSCWGSHGKAERPISFNVLESNVLGKVDILGFTTIAINSKVRKKDFGWVFSFIKFDRVSSFPCISAFSLCLICV